MSIIPRTLKALAAAVVVGLALVHPGTAQPPPAEDLFRTSRPALAAEARAESAPLPPVVLAAAAQHRAASFRAYMTTASAISPDFQNGGEVARGLKIAAGFEPRQLHEGAAAYVAVIALQQPEFVASIRRFSVDPEQRRDIARQLIARPDYATVFQGADRAAGAAIQALDGLGARLVVQGRSIERAAYTVQAQPWSKDPVFDRPQRLLDAKALSQTLAAPSAADMSGLRQAALAAAISFTGKPAPPPYARTIERGLAVAMLALLGEGGDDHQAAVLALLAADEPDPCLTFSKLMLYQCLAGSDQGHYEDMFCLAKHGLGDTGRCVVKTAGSPSPAFVEPVLPPGRAVSPSVEPPSG